MEEIYLCVKWIGKRTVLLQRKHSEHFSGEFIQVILLRIHNTSKSIEGLIYSECQVVLLKDYGKFTAEQIFNMTTIIEDSILDLIHKSDLKKFNARYHLLLPTHYIFFFFPSS